MCSHSDYCTLYKIIIVNSLEFLLTDFFMPTQYARRFGVHISLTYFSELISDIF